MQVDINPKQIARTHHIDVGIVADARLAGEQILSRLKDAEAVRKPDEARISRIADEKRVWREEIVDLAMEDGDPINPRRALLEISRVLPDDAIVTTDIGNVCSTSNSYLTSRKAASSSPR